MNCLDNYTYDVIASTLISLVTITCNAL